MMICLGSKSLKPRSYKNLILNLKPCVLDLIFNIIPTKNIDFYIIYVTVFKYYIDIIVTITYCTTIFYRTNNFIRIESSK